MRITSLLVLSGVLFSAAAFGADAKPTTMEQKFSYALGVQFGAQIGQEMKQKGLEVDAGMISQAIHDVLTGSKLQLSNDDMRAAVEDFRNKKLAERKVLAEKNQKASDEFLSKNKKAKGVKETPSGLQYKVLKAGTGKSPTKTDTVLVNYKGMLISGAEFDSSYKRGAPAKFPLNSVLKGWQEALPMMKEGAKWEIYVPPQLAYGLNGVGNAIGPNETLIFDIELLDINPPATKTK